MGIKSWYEESREYLEDEAKSETKRQEALADEAKWRVQDSRPHLAEDIMHEYANLMMERELKALGEELVQQLPNKEDRWMLACVVFQQYGRFCMFSRRPKEAAKWFKKALKYGVPYPYPVWKDLAAAYIESGEYEKADHWIQRYLKHYRKEGRFSKFDAVEFSKFYIETKYYERAIALLLEAHPDDKWHLDEKLYLADAYIGIGELEKGYAIYEEYLLKHPMDDIAFAKLALAYYEHSHDLERSEATYLKSIEAANNRQNVRDWNLKIYRNLSIIFANEGVWDKSFYYLKQHFLSKYEGHEADVFSQMIDSMPPIENDEMGQGFYQMIFAFEESPIRAGLHGHVQGEGTISENPASEVKDAEKDGSDFSKFINWDDILSN